jgi:hypothetical protein
MMAEHFDVPAPVAQQRWTAMTALVGSIGLAGFVLVACGGGSSKSASTPGPSSSSPSSSAAGSSTATAGSSTTTTSSASSSSAAPHGSSSSSFCSFAREVTSQQKRNVAVFTSGNPAAIERLEKQELSILNVAVSTAPSSIRPSMVIIATADRKLYTALQAVKFDFSKLSPAATQGLDSAALTHASDAVTSYITNVCHISTATPTAH